MAATNHNTPVYTELSKIIEPYPGAVNLYYPIKCVFKRCSYDFNVKDKKERKKLWTIHLSI